MDKKVTVIGAGNVGATAAQRLAEKELQRKENYFRALTENALDILTLLDAKGNFVFNSPSVETLASAARCSSSPTTS